MSRAIPFARQALRHQSLADRRAAPHDDTQPAAIAVGIAVGAFQEEWSGIQQRMQPPDRVLPSVASSVQRGRCVSGASMSAIRTLFAIDPKYIVVDPAVGVGTGKAIVELCRIRASSQRGTRAKQERGKQAGNGKSLGERMMGHPRMPKWTIPSVVSQPRHTIFNRHVSRPFRCSNRKPKPAIAPRMLS
jgi:hypothetical protein